MQLRKMREETKQPRPGPEEEEWLVALSAVGMIDADLVAQRNRFNELMQSDSLVRDALAAARLDPAAAAARRKEFLQIIGVPYDGEAGPTMGVPAEKVA
jgi:hypothetical protein